MNPTIRSLRTGTLVALVLLLCNAFIQSASATATCTPLVGGGAAQTYNNCTEICCATGVVSANNNDLSSCCHDAATGACPLGHKCCTPTPAITVAANQRSRACYAEDLQGCCSFQRTPSYDSSYNPTANYDARTYFKDEAQCCAARANGYYDQANGGPLVPKWVSSCVQHLADNNRYFKCFADGDCPENTKCCRRPQQTTETSTGMYNANSPGTCYDPAYTSCCAGGNGVKYGSSTQYNQTFYEAQLYNPFTSVCCTFPRNTGVATLIANINNGERCPCLQNTDCPSTNFTCCAPTEAQMQKAGSSYKRMIKCDAGCPTSGSPAGGSAYFQGCYGSCIASSTASKASDEVCLIGSALGNRCDNARVLSGTSFNVPTAAQLIKTDADLHWMDCCPSGTDSKAFNLFYNTRTEFCCPVVGTRKSGGTRFLSPTVEISATYSVGSDQQACLCSADSDCPNGQTCCAGANNLASGGSAALNFGNYTGLCYDSKVRSCCAYKTGLGYAESKVYNPTNEQCCAAGTQSVTTPCTCHSDAECVGASTACCAGAVRYGNGTHGVGTCYDTRTQSCCQTYAIDTAGFSFPIEDSRIATAPTVGRVYNNLTSVCCKWNGIQSSIRGCFCRADGDDCPNNGGCCASNGTAPAFQGLGRYQLGRCFNTKVEACCVNKWLAREDFPSVYNKEKQVCCPNNGVAPDHRSCKCGSNAECPANGECCLDGQAQGENVPTACPSSDVPCFGRCVHTAIETCCDDPFVSEFAQNKQVQACAAESQKCCNGKCCQNAFQTCKKTNVNKFNIDRDAPWSAFEAAGTVGYHYGLDKETEQCTTLEHSSPSIVFHTWVFPVFLSIAAIAFIAAGVKTALGSDISPNMVKLGLVGISVLVGLMSLLLLWSPLWKYGFVIVVANTIILSTFSVGGVWPKRFAVAVAIVCFLWVVEPFGSNSILNFGTTTYAGNAQNDKAGANGKWYNAHGLNYAARLLQRERGGNDGYDACTSFYQYWMVDSELYDQRQWNPAGQTRGICRRSWMHTITVMAGLITPFQTIFLLLAGLVLARGAEGIKEGKVQPMA